MAHLSLEEVKKEVPNRTFFKPKRAPRRFSNWNLKFDHLPRQYGHSAVSLSFLSLFPKDFRRHLVNGIGCFVLTY